MHLELYSLANKTNQNIEKYVLHFIFGIVSLIFSMRINSIQCIFFFFVNQFHILVLIQLILEFKIVAQISILNSWCILLREKN